MVEYWEKILRELAGSKRPEISTIECTVLAQAILELRERLTKLEQLLERTRIDIGPTRWVGPNAFED